MRHELRLLEYCKEWGLRIQFENVTGEMERVGDIVVEHAPLKGVEVSEHIAWLIDEVPALAIAFIFAKGESRLKNAGELRVKESDRIKAVVDNLRRYGVTVQEFDDGFSVKGENFIPIKANTNKDLAIIDSFGDHRIAMSFAILGIQLGAKIENISCINTSFPNFIPLLQSITQVEAKS